MLSTIRNLVSVLALPALLWGCGGGGDPAPGPLKYHFDDMYIARISIEEKQDVFKAQNDYAVAKSERALAETNFNENATQMDVAKNERKQALLEEKSAQSKVKAAKDSGDMNRVNTAKSELRAAELSRRAADQKIEMLKAQRAYLKKELRTSLEKLYAKEARFELAKARVAKDKNIKPKGFNYKEFETQSQDRSRRAQRYMALSGKDKSKFLKEKKKWEQMKREAEKAGGGPSSIPGDVGEQDFTEKDK